MTCCDFVRRVWTWLRPGQVLEKEDTTALSVSQAAFSDSNQNSSPSPPTERSPEPTRSSQTSLCNICAHGLSLDDSRAGGALEEPHNDGAPNLCFPSLGEREFGKYSWGEGFIWKGGAQYEQRVITPPHLPELSDECKFCCTVKSILLKDLGQREWWQTTITKLKLQVQYEWSAWKKKGGQLDFKLSSLKVKPEHPDLFTTLYSIEFPIATRSDSCKDWFHITGRHLDEEGSLSERNVNLIRSWLEQCRTDPCCCRSSKEEEFLPSRLLDLGAQGSGDLPVTLVDTRTMPPLRYEDRPLKYICLSYCWGAAQPPLRTTKGTIESYKSGIPMNSMPKVFRDVVLVARTLGTRYLWIDALCIIQDCPDDWENEAAAMAEIFSHSWMTVGAVTASSCHETLFYPRQKDLSIDINFQSSIKRNITGTISILLLSEYFGFPLDECLSNSTWDTRGWVWQEQKLPQRLLMFGEKMLHFRCHHRVLHEYGSHSGTSLSEPSHLHLDRPDTWEGVMHFYSRRKLTKGSDRLAAISGFVKEVAEGLENAENSVRYLAGIWLAENAKVDRQMCWFLENPTMSFRQMLSYHSDPQQYIAPSWSWLALNQPVNTFLNGARPVFQVVAYNITPARSDPTVAIAPGSSISLLGKLRNIPGRPSMAIKCSKPGGWRSDTWFEAPYSDNEEKKIRPYSGDEESDDEGNDAEERTIKYYLDWDPSTEDFAEGDSEAHLKLFLVSEFGGTLAVGLVLFPVDPGLFLRVGYFEIWAPWESPDWKETKVVVI